MKPASFFRLVPTSVPEALAMLDAHAPEACVLAGGQSLVPMMNFRLARPPVLVDLNGVSELAYIRDEGDYLAIGAMTRERTIENSDLVRAASPLMHEATLHIGHLPIRSRGTIGGSIANADPAAEYPAVVLALDGTLVAQSLRGERHIPADQFFDGVMSTALEPDEVLTEIIVPKMPPDSGAAFVEIARRHGDFALAGVAAQLTLAGDIVTSIRLAACGVGPCPIRLVNAEAQILAGGLSDSAIKAAVRAAVVEVDPDGDVHATVAYRRHLAGVMTKRALVKAGERARQTA
jgi:aerobic carbon-monoxide dehydrogenase medium subunit